MTGTRRSAANGAARTSNGALEQRIHDAVLGAILEYRLTPGMRLVEADLCALFDASRAAVRAALARLAERGLVELRPNRGAIVAVPSLNESREIYGARRAIETAVARTLARAPRRAVLGGLRKSLLEEDRAYRSGDLREALRLSMQFHLSLARAAGNDTLSRFLETLLARTPLVVLMHTTSATPHYCGNAEHREIVAAIARGDGDSAARLVERHLDHLEGQLRSPAAPLTLPSLRDVLRPRPRNRTSPAGRDPAQRKTAV